MIAISARVGNDMHGFSSVVNSFFNKEKKKLSLKGALLYTHFKAAGTLHFDNNLDSPLVHQGLHLGWGGGTFLTTNLQSPDM